MNTPDPRAFATRWCAQWNAHDLEGLLTHFTDDVVFTSPVPSRVLGGDGTFVARPRFARIGNEGSR